MTFRAVKPFRLRLNGQSQTIAQGQTFELDPDAGAQLLSKAPGLVTSVVISVNIGNVVRWCSPLFGNLMGDVLLTAVDTILVNHPVIGQPAWIRRSWIICEPGKDKLHAR